MTSPTAKPTLDKLLRLRQYTKAGERHPHKPLLVLLALRRFAETGDSRLAWSDVEDELANLISEFGPPSKTSPAQSAAYPFTRLARDAVWVLEPAIEVDSVTALRAEHVTGRLEAPIEAELRADPTRLPEIARHLAESQFPPTLVPDVLAGCGFDVEAVLSGSAREIPESQRRRSAAWRTAVLQAWNRQCAFCGFDGRLGTASVGLDAAHVRWFNFDGPDELDNGLALCSLHHKLLDRGALGLDNGGSIVVSTWFTAATAVGQAISRLHGMELAPRPGTPMPNSAHVRWHRQQVFKGEPLGARPG